MSQGSIAAGSVQVSWLLGATAKSAQADSSGVFSGDATGSVDHNTGRFNFWPNELPAFGSSIRYQWIKAGSKTQADIAGLDVVISGLTVTGTIPDAPLVGGQAVLVLTLDTGADVELLTTAALRLVDNGAGKLVEFGTTTVRGTINVTTGELSITAPSVMNFRVKKYSYKEVAAEFGTTPAWTWTSTAIEQHSVRVKALSSCWYLAMSNPDQLDKTYALDALSFDLTPHSKEVIVEGSLRFTFGGQTYIDRLGYLYCNVDPATGSGLQAGTIDYSNAVVKITQWQEGAPNAAPVIQSLLTYVADHTVSDIAFRTPGAPLRPGSLYIQCTDVEGGTHDITAPTSGVIDSDIFHGKLDHDTGVCVLAFGKKVTASDYMSAAWYDADLVDANGKILKPVQVLAESLRYNCVTYSYLPLDKTIIGLDPVRLPTDGRVPVLRRGELAVIHSTKRTPWPNGVMAGQQLDVGRTRLAKCWLEDATGTKLAASLYSVDLDYGIVTLATPLLLTGYTQPLAAVHRVEDISMMTDVEISGRITLGKALSHDYEPADSYVSSALIIDNTWSRVTNVFEQKTWTGVWSDSLIGDATTAQFNATDYPIITSNRGALTERFALVFDSSTTFRVYGEHLGLIAAGNINETCAPSNPNHPGVPMFSINPLSFGLGWSSNNVVRFDLIGADAPFWAARTILQSDAAIDSDSYALQLRGNVNKD